MVIGEIRFAVPGQRDERRMMPVVVPKRVEIVAALAARFDQLRFLRLVFRDEQDRSIAGGLAGCAADRTDDVFLRFIVNALGRVESKPVEMKFLDPISPVGDKEFADRTGVAAVEIDRVAPFVRAFAVDVIV